MKSTIFVHVGAPRTGTSFLRSQVFPNVENVVFEDKKCSNTELIDYFASISHLGDGDELSASLSFELPNAPIGKHLISEEHLIWSVYHMMGNIGSRALILKQAVPNAKIILTIRRQPEYFTSIFRYFQELESWHLHGKMKSLHKMLNLTNYIRKLKVYRYWMFPVGLEIEMGLKTYPIDDAYFKRHWRHFIAADFSWFRLYEIYSDLFGNNNVLVLPQEIWSKDPERGLLNLENFFGEKINKKNINFSKKINASRKKRIFKTDSERNIYHNLVMKKVIESNSKLAGKLSDIELEKYGYCDISEDLSARPLIFGKKSETSSHIPSEIVDRINLIIEYLDKMGPLAFLKIALKKGGPVIWRNIRLGRRIYRLCMFLSDYIKGVDFERMESIRELGLNHLNSEQYEATNLMELKKVIDKISFPESISAIDFGAGKGRVVNFLSKNPNIAFVSGIELSKTLVDVANENLTKLNTVNAKMYCADARDTPTQLIDDAQLFYFYNPFPREVFADVFKMIEESLIKRNPRKAILIYVNPVCDDIVISSKVFSNRKEFKNTISRAHTVVYVTSDF